MAGSDFDPKFFTATELNNFQTILTRLREFEKTVAHSFRTLEKRVDQIEENVKTNKNSLSGTKGSITKLRNALKNMENNFKGNLNLAVPQNESEDETEINDEVDLDLTLGAEIKMGDPFLNGGSFISGYDGNPSISFSKWIEKFKDILSLITTPLTEEQKLARLRFCLNGQARAVYDSINPAPTRLEDTIVFLKNRFENGNTKIIARQTLSICKQAPGEPVFDFSNRLNEAVRTALSGDPEESIKKRLLEEFLDRLVPELQFQVKSQRPTDYVGAYELAQHFELLLSARKPAINISMSELAEKVDALVVSKNKPDVVTCYSCRKPGHIARYCTENPRNINGNRNSNYDPRVNYGPRNFENRPRYENNARPNYNGGYQNNNRYSNRREGNNYRQYNNRQTSSQNNYRNYGNYQNRRGNSNSRENSRSSERGSTPRVRFQRRSSPGIKAISPILFMFIALLSVLCCAAAQNPMICLNNSPTSLWKFPEDPICPSWRPSESPVPLNLYVYRANTLEYKTPATVCKCIKSKISRRLGVFGSKYEEIETENINVPISLCTKMKETNNSQAGKLFEKNGNLKATNNSLEVGWNIWPLA
uniref:CCHC-type domain-containing protein n=2 Tax=Meloidogyne TaxID=189290 RepID=A0A6V7W4A0_MELEN|nr:unnamed protein product [Meloidogyne enterolobii]